MIEQKIIINLTDIDFHEIGILHISSMNYNSDEEIPSQIFDSMTFENVPVVDEPDNSTPLQFWGKSHSNFAKLMFLEETEYHVLFEATDINASFIVLHSLVEINKNSFKPLNFILGDNKKFQCAGILNFRSYVGKSFLDVKKDDINSIKIPIEVRSKKIDYFNQYSAMIADLSQHSLSLLFDVNSPLYQEFNSGHGKKETFYEDFMFLEYLFRPDNLPAIFEYLVMNLHSQLKTHSETVPLPIASKFDQNTLKNIMTKPQLVEVNNSFQLANKLKGHLPYEIEQIKHEDIIDIPENRFFKYFLVLIQNLIDDLLTHAKKGYIEDKLLSFRDELDYYLSYKFFNHISPMSYVPFNSQILHKKEGYREIFHYFLLMEFSFKLSWNEVNDKVKGFEKRLSELYEYWCYFKILKVLNMLSIDKIGFENIFKVNKDKWSIKMNRGIDSLKSFRLLLHDHEIDVKLFYNLKFSDNPVYRSYSLPFKPDYTLLITIEGHKYYVHFDAKYRSELDEGDHDYKIDESIEIPDEKIEERDFLEEKGYIFKEGDIYKMHTYKDSILDSEGAYVLYPGSITKKFRESSCSIPSVGAFSLTPGDDGDGEDNLKLFIISVLETLLFKNGLITKDFVSIAS